MLGVAIPPSPSLPLRRCRPGSLSRRPPSPLAPTFPHASSCSQWWGVPPCCPWLVGWLPGPFIVICPPVLIIPSPSPPSLSSFSRCLCSLVIVFVPSSLSLFPRPRHHSFSIFIFVGACHPSFLFMVVVVLVVLLFLRVWQSHLFPHREELLTAVVGGSVMVMAVVVVIRPKNKNKKVFY